MALFQKSGRQRRCACSHLSIDPYSLVKRLAAAGSAGKRTQGATVPSSLANILEGKTVHSERLKKVHATLCRELERHPEIERGMKEMVDLQNRDKGAVARCANSWMQTIKKFIFSRWVEVLARQGKGKGAHRHVFCGAKQLKVRPFFQAWRSTVQSSRSQATGIVVDDIVGQIVAVRKELDASMARLRRIKEEHFEKKQRLNALVSEVKHARLILEEPTTRSDTLSLAYAIRSANRASMLGGIWSSRFRCSTWKIVSINTPSRWQKFSPRLALPSME